MYSLVFFKLKILDLEIFNLKDPFIYSAVLKKKLKTEMKIVKIVLNEKRILLQNYTHLKYVEKMITDSESVK